MNVNPLWSRILLIAGSIALLVGAVDPMEGSLLILPGSGLVALGTFLNPDERQWLTYRLSVFGMILLGVAALWALSFVGGIGGKSGYSMWWGLLILPYFIGWSLSIWGPGAPRWFMALGMVISAWYIVFSVLLIKGMKPDSEALSMLPAVFIGFIGFMTMTGCIVRMKKQKSPEPKIGA